MVFNRIKNKFNKVFVLISLMFFFTLFFSNNSSALSNESLIANQSLHDALENIKLMQDKDIPINRVNDIFNEAIQLYEAQTALEEKGKVGNYDLINDRTREIEKIKDYSFSADDELDVFIQTYNSVSENTNLSSMQKDYENIISSFNEERFEDTIVLIEEGYNKISEIESSQTILKLFYDETTKSIKKWFYENYKNLFIILIFIILFYFIFRSSLRRISIGRELKKLNLRKSALNNLIRKIQYQYFKENKISETEFRVKIERFKEMIRDVDRQIPLLNEKLAKLDYKNKSKEISISEKSLVKKNISEKKKK